ncbi:MAG: hypothetical protein C0502_04580 [Opitutus sp.]|nr:hypothetical protein [Opitutus sp.]
MQTAFSVFSKPGLLSRRFLTLLFAGVVVGWLAIASASWLFLRHYRAMQTVRLPDTLLPWRWSRLQQALGGHYLRQAALATERGEPGLALHLYRSGLSRAPDNAAGRIGLAELCVALNQIESAKATLLAGTLSRSGDREYLSYVLQFLLEHHFDSELQATCETLLAGPLPPASRRVVAVSAASLAYHRGDFARTAAILTGHGLVHETEGLLLLARIDLELGFPESALLRLNNLARSEAAPDVAYELLDRVHRELGQWPARQSNAVRRIAADPLGISPRIALLRLHADTGNRTALDREVAGFLAHHDADSQALLALGELAASLGRVDVAQQIVAVFHGRLWPAHIAEMLVAETLLAAGRDAEALQILDALAPPSHSANPRFAAARDGLRLIAFTALKRSDEARLAMAHLLAQPGHRAGHLHRIATRLLALGERLSALQLLERAVDLDPRDPKALSELVRLELEIGRHDTLPAHVLRLLSLRRPPRELLEAVARAWGRDRFLLHPEQAGLLRAIRAGLESPVNPSPAPPRAS